MVKRYRLAAGGLAAAMTWTVVAGCDSSGPPGDRTPPPDQPATVNPPTTVPATQPAATQPAGESYLWLKEVPDPRRKTQADAGAAQPTADPDDFGNPVKFPRARLKLAGKGDHHLVALLYSDDPKEALKADWQGDRYYFRMPLQIADRTALDGQLYRMAVPLDGADETTTGVFLAGDRYHLEPVDLSVEFLTQGPRVRVRMGGLFKQFDSNNPQSEPRWFHVQGIIQAAVD